MRFVRSSCGCGGGCYGGFGGEGRRVVKVGEGASREGEKN